MIEARPDELRIADEVGRLLEAAPELLSSMMAAGFIANIQKYVGGELRGRGVPSRTRLPVSKQTIRCWLELTQKPSLPLLLKLGAALEISSVDLFRGGWPEGPSFSDSESIQDKQRSNSSAIPAESYAGSLPVNWSDVESNECVKKRLQAAIDADPPISLTSVAKEFNCAKATLRKIFPELSAQVAAKASAYYRPPISEERMAKEVCAALKESPPPPLQEVSRRLGPGASTTTLHNKFPEESRRIVERYRSHAKRRLDNKHIEKKLRAALKRNPPPSMPEVSREIGVARATLHSKFPDLCKTISSRFAAHRRLRDAHNRERAKAEIRSICENAVRSGLYPGDALVRSQLTVPCQSQAISEIRRKVIDSMTLPYALKK